MEQKPIDRELEDNLETIINTMALLMKLLRHQKEIIRLSREVVQQRMRTTE